MNPKAAEATTEQALTRAEVYRLLADALIYPDDAWAAQLTDGYAADLLECLSALDESTDAAWLEPLERFTRAVDGAALADLQRAHRYAFGTAAGTPPYETEYGQPHAFRQAYELADIAGFYRAFGFDVGGRVRERPDFLGVELEFMYVLALKHIYALADGLSEAADLCQDAQRKFLRDHLARWVGTYARKLRDNADGPYAALAALVAAFVAAEARRFGVEIGSITLADARPTPLGLPLSCMGCETDDGFSF